MGEIADIIAQTTGCPRRKAELAEQRVNKLLKTEQRRKETVTADITEVLRTSDEAETTVNEKKKVKK